MLTEKIVLIPAYKPDERLIDLCRELSGGFKVVVVNDGSGTEFDGIFDAVAALANTHVISYEVNRGKGAAMKTGIAHIIKAGLHGCIVTADADGQHSYTDITRLFDAMEANPDTLVIGGRDFSKMPLRSRAGNTITRFVFRLGTGLSISDTQTGLRGLPECLWERLCALAGDRYEYEMNMLLELKHWGTAYLEIPIETIYIDNNSSTHFHALHDGLRVFSRVLKFCASSLISGVVDYALYMLFTLWLPTHICYIAARVISATLNYQLNRRVVFHGRPSVWTAIGYFALVIAVMVTGSAATSWFVQLGVSSLLSKLMVDTVLFVVNYFIQKYLIFRNPVRANQPDKE